MRRYALVGLVGATVALSCRGATPVSAPSLDPARALIPPGEVRADIMDVHPSARMEALAAKFNAAARADPNGFLRRIQDAGAGQPLPYDPALGLTKAEYDEFLRDSKELRLEKVGESTLRFASVGDSRFRVVAGDALPQLSDVIIDLKRDAIDTPYGLCSDRSDIVASPEQTVTGQWDGIQWHFEQGDATTTATSVSFAIGRLVVSRRGILYYNAKRVVNGRSDPGANVVLTYALP
jgi:hypothetical protein